MNKLLIVLLAICLISVHAFVKRDAPEAPKGNEIEELAKQAQEFFTDAGNKVKEAVDPEKLKEGFNQFVENVNKALDDLKKKNADKQ